MDTVQSATRTKLLTSFVDVLYLTDQVQIPSEVKHLIRQKKLSHKVLPIDAYPQVCECLDLVGTVVIDAEAVQTSDQEQLVRIIESLEMEKIGVILLTSKVATRVKSFSISPAKSSFSMSPTTEAISIDDLWFRVSLNLASRKRSAGMTVKSPIPTRHLQRVYRNRLAEQLQMAEALVDSLAEQLRLAGMVQQDFLPSQLPSGDNLRWSAVFLPAEWVSGDIYNVVRIDDQHIGFYVADVVGHGMPAALLTIFVKQTLTMREMAGEKYKIFSPAEAMRNLNVRMAAQKLSGYQFATCCYCLLDTKTLELTLARAGHPYPILIRPNEPPRQIEARGSLLGVFEQAEYADVTLQFQRGDKLLLYSDGAERFVGNYDDKKGFHFSQEFLSLCDKSIVDLTESIKAFAQDQALNCPDIDDITAVGLEIL
jgi:sigma-B regulation protein RsbU (phosphoserine phosphatase)